MSKEDAEKKTILYISFCNQTKGDFICEFGTVTNNLKQTNSLKKTFIWQEINGRFYLSSACRTVLAIPNRELIAAAAPPPLSSIRAPTNDKIMKVETNFTSPLIMLALNEESAPNKYKSYKKSAC